MWEGPSPGRGSGSHLCCPLPPSPDALHNVLTKASLLLVLLLNVVVSILPTLAYRIYQHTVKEPRFKVRVWARPPPPHTHMWCFQGGRTPQAGTTHPEAEATGQLWVLTQTPSDSHLESSWFWEWGRGDKKTLEWFMPQGRRLGHVDR